MKNSLNTNYNVRHCFSIELFHRDQLNCINLPPKTGDHVLIDGSLGELKEINLIDRTMIEILCTNGTLRMELTDEEYLHTRMVK